MDKSSLGGRGIRLLRRLFPRWLGFEREIDDEVRFHLDTRADELARSGVARPDATRQAQAEFGDVTQARAELAAIDRRRAATERRVAWWSDLGTDIRFARRSLFRSPGFTLVAVATLAIGLGANATIFTVIDAVVLRPLPYPDAGQLISIATRFGPASGHDLPLAAGSWPEMVDYARQAKQITRAGVFIQSAVTFGAGDGTPERLEVADVSSSLFEVLGVRPALGRGLVSEDDEAGAACSVILGDRLWRTRFGGRPEIIGQPIDLEGLGCRVVGVMPPGFGFPRSSIQLWRGLGAYPADLRAERESHWLGGVARLAPHATIADARAEALVIGSQWAASYPNHHRGHDMLLRPLKEAAVGSNRATLEVLWIAVALVLALVAANVANLQLNRVEARRPELAVRSALGAGRWRLVRQLLVESFGLAGLGWALGVLLASWGVRAFLLVYPTALPRAETVALSGKVLSFSALIAAVTALAIGLLPALHLGKGDTNLDLRNDSRSVGGSRSSRNLRSILVTAQVALAVGIVVPAFLLVQSYRGLNQIDLGIVTNGTLTASVALPVDPYRDVDRISRYYDDLFARLATPDIQASGAIRLLPVEVGPGGDDFVIEGRPEPAPGEPQISAGYLLVTPGVFRALGIPIRSGRGLTAGDRGGTELVAVVNEAAARRYWPNENPIGRRIHYYPPDTTWITIVGVVGDTRGSNVADPPQPAVYTALAQNARPRNTSREMEIVVRTRTSLEAGRAAILATGKAIDPRVPIARIRPLVEVTRENVGPTRFAAQVISGFALAATLLGLIGVYGVVSYIVRQRYREIGVRMALGATPGRVAVAVIKTGVGPIVVGVILGLTAAVIVTRSLSSLLYGVAALDPPTYVLVALVLAGAGIAACLLPALRAAGVDPRDALRR